MIHEATSRKHDFVLLRFLVGWNLVVGELLVLVNILLSSCIKGCVIMGKEFHQSVLHQNCTATVMEDLGPRSANMSDRG